MKGRSAGHDRLRRSKGSCRCSSKGQQCEGGFVQHHLIQCYSWSFGDCNRRVGCGEQSGGSALGSDSTTRRVFVVSHDQGISIERSDAGEAIDGV